MKPVLFVDFHGTLCHDLFWRTLPAESLKKIHIFEFDEDHIAARWMRGEFTSEEINQKLAKIIGIDYQELWEIFVENCKTMQVSTQTLEYIRELNNKFHTVLITDNMDCFDRFTVPALQLTTYFELIVNSYNERQGKNDLNGKLFHDTAKKFHTNIQNFLLIDDSESSCELFKKEGGSAYQVTPQTPVDFWLDQCAN